MSSETQLKIINNLIALLGYLPLSILMVLSKISLGKKVLMLILFLGPRLYEDLKDGTFKI